MDSFGIEQRIRYQTTHKTLSWINNWPMKNRKLTWKSNIWIVYKWYEGRFWRTFCMVPNGNYEMCYFFAVLRNDFGANCSYSYPYIWVRVPLKVVSLHSRRTMNRELIFFCVHRCHLTENRDSIWIRCHNTCMLYLQGCTLDRKHFMHI